jgi:hypothetical protein
VHTLAKVATILAKIVTVLVATSVVVIVVLMLAYTIAASGYNPFDDDLPRRGFSLAAGGAPRANLGH